MRGGETKEGTGPCPGSSPAAGARDEAKQRQPPRPRPGTRAHLPGSRLAPVGDPHAHPAQVIARAQQAGAHPPHLSAGSAGVGVLIPTTHTPGLENPEKIPVMSVGVRVPRGLLTRTEPVCELPGPTRNEDTKRAAPGSCVARTERRQAAPAWGFPRAARPELLRLFQRAGGCVKAAMLATDRADTPSTRR